MEEISTDTNRGAHGYATNLTSMRAIFLGNDKKLVLIFFL